MRQTVTTDEYKALVRDFWTEDEFTRQVAELAQSHGWFVAHFAPARTTRGWRTPCRFDAEGFPDLLMLRGQRQIAAELKVGRRKATPAQLAWLERFAAVGAEANVWYPRHWNLIEKTLD